MENSAADRDTVLMRFLSTLRKFASSHPEIGVGLCHRRNDFHQQFSFLADQINGYPATVVAYNTDDDTVNMRTLESMFEDFEQESYIEENAYMYDSEAEEEDDEDEDEDEYEEGDTTILAPPASQLLSKSTLPPEPEDSPSQAPSSSVDPSIESQATAKDVEALPALLGVETPKPVVGEEMEELVLLYGLASQMENFLRGRGPHTDNFSSIELASYLHEQLNAANRADELDGGVESQAAPGHIVTEILKVVESRSGSTPGSRIARLETTTIDDTYVQRLFDFETETLLREYLGFGLKLALQLPRTPQDTVEGTVLPLVQLWKQLWEERCLFGIAYSDKFVVLAFKDLRNPKRLYLSRCHSTELVGSEEPVENTEAGVYTVFNLMRIATRKEYSDAFLRQLHEEMDEVSLDEQGNLVPVYWRDIKRVGIDLASKGEGAIANGKEGTVRVASHDQAGSTQEALHPAEDAEEESFVEELLLADSDTELDHDTQPEQASSQNVIMSQYSPRALRSTTRQHAGEVKAPGRVTRSVTKAAQASEPANKGGARGRGGKRRGGRGRG
ncbi:hypothetical protein R3P38DRAFT_3492063 [Favolaschia claudopus]|uniref:Uncharacterized protein n=1 Tax=Favolaschia claudopus TaxID=2862362 RepID=A0AAW0EFI6_9AGAR